MTHEDRGVFPFAEFDPLLRRDLCAALAAVERDLGIADAEERGPLPETAREARLKRCAIARLRALAEGGERDLERLREETRRTCSEETHPV